MKKTISLTMFFVFITITAQNRYGIKAGVNIAQTTTNTRDARYAYHGGIMAEMKVNKGLFGFQSELLYSQQGFANNSNNIKIISKVDYISIPFMFKYFLLENLSLEIGPQFSFNCNGEEETIIKNSNTDNTIKLEGLRFFEFGMNVGIGHTFNNGVNLSFRYNRGMNNIYEITFNDVITQNSVLQISTGFLF